MKTAQTLYFLRIFVGNGASCSMKKVSGNINPEFLIAEKLKQIFRKRWGCIFLQVVGGEEETIEKSREKNTEIVQFTAEFLLGSGGVRVKGNTEKSDAALL